jgi:hypothetical protein
MASSNITEAYYSSVSVIADTISQGVIDISEDVQSCSVNRQVNGASSATITLTNYSSYKNGRYNGLLHIGDRVHVAFIKDSFSIDQLTGKIAQVPVIAFNEGSFTFTVYDVIHDLSYIYWDPYAEDSLERYSLNADKLIRYAEQEGYNDSGIGIALKDFLSADDGVCHLPKDAVKIAKFPDTSETMQNIVNAAMQNADKTSIDQSAEELYVMLFGGHSSSSQASSTDRKDDSKYNWLLESNISGKRLAAITAKLFSWSKVDTNSTEWDKNIQFKDNGKWRSWHLHDNDYHSGLYGLSRTQMIDFAKYNGEAMLADKKTQDKAIAGVYDSLSKKSAYHAIWQYFNGWVLDYDDKGNIKYGKNSKFKVGTHEMKTVDEWKGFVNRAADEVSNNVKDSSKDKKKQQKDKKTQSEKNKDNALAASFGSWVKNNTGRYPTTFRDGSSTQCWNLWEWYYQDFLKLDQSQWVIQPASGNQGFAQYAVSVSKYYASNFEVISDPNKVQAGDVAFWKNGAPNDISYGHVSIVIGTSGDKITDFGQNPKPPTVGTFEPKTALSGALRPKALGGVPGSTDGASGSSSSSSGSSVSDVDDLGLKLFKFVNYMTPSNTPAIIESYLLKGSDTGLNMANDKPAIDYVDSCCKASMRAYMSLPDGSFAAFVPDWFGKMFPDSKYHNVIDIPRHEVMKFKADFDKSSYVSHLFLTTNEALPDPYGLGITSGLNDLMKLLTSSGTVTMQYQGANLLKLMDISSTGLDQNDPDALNKLMQRWGVSVKRESDEYIQNAQLTAISALYRFLQYWANCFTSTMQLTFRPEIMPGLRLHFADAGVTLYVKSVQHSWNATSGGTTNVTVVSPVTDQDRAGISGS